MSNIKKPKKFLCLDDPVDHQYKTWDDVQKYHFYYQYNNSGDGPLSAIFIWLPPGAITQ
jgi:hypothetical protein